MKTKVKNRTRRDDLIKNRLYPFLYSKASINVSDLKLIKPHVFWVKTEEGKEYILKSHQRIDHVKQQWGFFMHIKPSRVITPFVHFPNGEPFIVNQKVYWTISPFIQGRKLRYEDEIDRKLAIQSLKQFHHVAFGIYPDEPILHKAHFIVRWRQRLFTFMETEYIFKKLGYYTLYKDIVKTMRTRIDFALGVPWESFNLEARRKGQWIHGDVASHNFILSNDDRVSLIDFDLLTMGSPLYDYIQLSQRFLPHIRWELDTLLEYNMVPENHIKHWLSGILVPSDVLREWIYFISRRSITSVPSYLSKMEADWIERGRFLKKAKSMIKSMT